MTHQLDTIHPTIQFMYGSGSYQSKRFVRTYPANGTGEPCKCLCVSARGKLWKITPTGPRSASCDLTVPALVDFGSRQKAREEAQSIAPVATLAKLGIKRPPRSKSRAAYLEEEVSELRSQIAEMTSTLDGYRNGSE